MAVMLGGMPVAAWATTEASTNDVSVRKMGVAWNIADDRKLENTAGVYGPEGLDKYMKRYFDQLFAKTDQLSSKIDKLSAQIAALEKSIPKKETVKVSSQGSLV